MLGKLRTKASSWIVKIMFGFLVASFAVWGIGDIFRVPGRDSVVAEVGERTITGNEFIAEYQRQLEQLRPLFDERLDAERARDLGIPDTVLQRMVNRAILDAAADDLGLTISDAVLRAAVVSDPSFRSAGGMFDRFTYEQKVRSAGYSTVAYEAALRRELARMQLAGTVQAGATAPDPLVEALYRYRNERRVFDVVTVPNHLFEAGEPSEAELDAFHREHPDRFTAPEYRAVTMVRLEAEDLAAEIAVPEEEVRQAYEANPGRFRAPGRRKIRQMLLGDEETARRAYETLKGGAGFGRVAGEIAGLDEADTEIGWVTKETMVPDLVEPVFALEEGAFSAPLQSPLGWHIVKVDEVTPEMSRSFEEVRDQLRDEIAAEYALDGLYNLANQLEDELAGGATLEEAAARVNLKPVKVEAIDRDGLGPDGEEIAGLPGPEFVETAFSTAEGQQSLLTETPQGGYFILRVDKVTPSALKPLDGVRDQVVAAWKEETRTKAAERRAREIVERVRSGEALADVAAEMGLEVTATEPLKRGDPGLHPYLALRLFQGPVGEVATAVAGGGYAVAQLERIEPADPAADKEGVKELRRELGRALGADLLVQYGTALHDRYTVKVNKRVIDSLF